MTTDLYAVHLASVAVDEVERLRAGPGGRSPDQRLDVAASRVVECPHDLADVELVPLGQVLAEALDIGQPLRADAWHPLRAPVVVDPETVTARAMALDEAYRAVADQLGGMMADVLGADIDKVRDVYTHASRRGEAIISFLSAPSDEARAARTLLPRVQVG